MRFILLASSDFHRIDSQSVAIHAFASRVLTSFSVNENTASLIGELVHLFNP